MPEVWTGRLIGAMHIAGVKQTELAYELGCSKVYISQILNGRYAPRGAEEKLNEAFRRICERKGVSYVGW